MIWNIHITQQAEQDINKAANYIEFALLNPDAADALLETVDKKINSLSQFPDRNRPVDDPVLSLLGIRFIMVNNYLAFYIISKENATVHIIRFLHEKQNWTRILKQRNPLY